ncbi:hypothetical protein RintRC_2173 [Richelia intracellularis]|nr:hypothetical protein RintRC_2173 [Richelia intracellularis]
MRDDFTKFSTISQWFQTLIHPALMQRPVLNRNNTSCPVVAIFVN